MKYGPFIIEKHPDGLNTVRIRDVCRSADLFPAKAKDIKTLADAKSFAQNAIKKAEGREE